MFFNVLLLYDYCYGFSQGFIGSCLVNELNYLGYYNLILVDDFSNQNKNKNLKNTKFHKKIDRNYFIDWLKNNYKEISFVPSRC